MNNSTNAKLFENPYVKTWALLVLLLIISVIGPMFEIKFLTLVTAFGIALVKAYLVAKHFMHLNIEKQYIVYILLLCIAFMALLFFGIAPDLMKFEGINWEHDPAKFLK